ncbi:hypothetical protein ACFO0N_17090 [Halobium salinum]|uniref:DUF8118 domain-containing protein n=1 Tax=Halobium salinum TaxID=1364940 RepID=A0ABD5PFP4_9EURY|nr:hypothetical protein [Halobium salinum]
MNAERVIAQEGTDETSKRTDESHGSETNDSDPGEVTGPHFGRDEQGQFDHRFWRCAACGFESIDPRLQWGCFRCADDADADAAADGDSADTDPRDRRRADAD